MVAMSEEIGKLANALCKAQQDLGIAVKNQNNEYFASPYADLTAVLGVIKPALADHDLAMVQYPGYEDGCVTMTTLLVHASGEFIESPVASIPISKRDPHGAASGISYLRRYCASSLMALIAADDDGNAAVGPMPKGAKRTKATATKKPTKKLTERIELIEVAKDWNEAEHLMESLNMLSGLVSACEEHGGVDDKHLKAAAGLLAEKGPIERVEKAIKHLESEVARV